MTKAQSDPVAERTAAGAAAGILLGFALFAVVVQFVAPPLPGATPRDVAMWALRMIPGFTVGGALTGATIGRLLPVLRDPLAGVPVCTVAASFYIGGLRLAGRGVSGLTLGTLAGLATCALVLGGVSALLGREILRHGEPRSREVPGSWNELLWRVLEIVAPRRRRRSGRREKRRARIRAAPFPETWRRHIAQNVPYVRTLSGEDREELEKQVAVFVAEKHYEGCGGLVLDDEVRVTIAAQACLLTLRLDADYYPRLRTILVYPSTFVPKRSSLRPPWADTDPPVATLGQSWTWGIVIVSWDSVLAGAANPRDGRNLVLHEFAHQLDQETGAGDGVPVLPPASSYRTWAAVLQAHFAELVDATERGRRVTLRAYGATNPAEFFAVATETFFEKPRQLRTQHPALYEELSRYFGQDPAAQPADAIAAR